MADCTTSHDFVKEYYGVRCSRCDLFYPEGCAPWDANLDDEVEGDFGDWDDEEDFPFDCHMDRNGQCGKTGSEECDFECPIMADIYRREREKKAKALRASEEA